MARPRLKIDPDMVSKLATIGCTVGEIASVLGCSPDTLQRRFAAVIKTGIDRGNSSLRRKQFELALAGDKTMLVWLGKQRLGQKDKSDVTSADQAMAPVTIAVTHTVVDPSAG